MCVQITTYYFENETKYFDSSLVYLINTNPVASCFLLAYANRTCVVAILFQLKKSSYFSVLDIYSLVNGYGRHFIQDVMNESMSYQCLQYIGVTVTPELA